jgi:hypothetical protein
MTKDAGGGDLIRGGPGIDKSFADRADGVRAEQHGTGFPRGCSLLD